MFRSKQLFACLLAAVALPLFAQDEKAPKVDGSLVNPRGGGGSGGWSEPLVEAIDIPGIPTTARKLPFTGDPSNNFVAFDPVNRKELWHIRLTSNVSNGPSTVLVDGKQLLIVGAGDTLWAFELPGK